MQRHYKQRKDAYLMNWNGGKPMYSVLFCVSAVGRYLPPFVVYKRKYMYSIWTEPAPAGWLFFQADGCMTMYLKICLWNIS